MKKAEIEQFLDTGWHNDATLYYQGFIYWCEGLINSKTDMFEFSVERWEVDIVDDQYYASKTTSDGKYLNYKVVFEVATDDPQAAKKLFLEAKIFDGRSFWEIGHEIKWLDE